MSDIADLITAHVRDVPDYPQPGVLFKDITPLLGDSDAFGDVVEAIAATFGPVDKVVGIAVLMELSFLGGRATVGDLEVRALLTV